MRISQLVQVVVAFLTALSLQLAQAKCEDEISEANAATAQNFDVLARPLNSDQKKAAEQRLAASKARLQQFESMSDVESVKRAFRAEIKMYNCVLDGRKDTGNHIIKTQAPDDGLTGVCDTEFLSYCTEWTKGTNMTMPWCMNNMRGTLKPVPEPQRALDREKTRGDIERFRREGRTRDALLAEKAVAIYGCVIAVPKGVLNKRELAEYLGQKP